MNLKRYLSAVALAFALSDRTEAQSISTESMIAPKAGESKVLRFDGTYNKREFSAFGLLDFLGKFDSFYGELYLRQNLAGKSGMQFEINGGTGYGPVYRAGFITDVPMPKGAYMNLKLLPLTAKWNDLLPQLQIGVFGRIDMPKGFYFALQGQVAYDVGFKGWLSRSGARYSF